MNRECRDNVLLGPPDTAGPGGAGPDVAAAVLAPRPGHHLDPAGTGLTVHSLVEASRQFCTVLEHRAAGRPEGTALHWLGVTADVPAAPTGSYSLRWPTAPVGADRLSLGFALLDDGEPAGSFTYEAGPAPGADYHRLPMSA